MGYGAEVFLPFNNRFGISLGYKELREIVYKEANVVGPNQNDDVILRNEVISSYSIGYLNLVLYLGKAFHIYGGANVLTTPVSFESIASDSSGYEAGMKVGWQAGAGYKLTDFLALFAQYDVYYFAGQGNRYLKIDNKIFYLNDEFEMFTAVIQAGLRLDLGF